jgi:hypothetical protein
MAMLDGGASRFSVPTQTRLTSPGPVGRPAKPSGHWQMPGGSEPSVASTVGAGAEFGEAASQGAQKTAETVNRSLSKLQFGSNNSTSETATSEAGWGASGAAEDVAEVGTELL